MKYNRVLFLTFIFSLASLTTFPQEVLNLEECYERVETHYPLTRQASLLEGKLKNETARIQKEKLPKLDLNAQASYQSDVIQFPFQMPNTTLIPPNKDQYRASLDVNQLIYNGGTIATNTRLKEAELQTQQQQVVVNLYALRSQVNYQYFSVLLYQEQGKLLDSKMKELTIRLNEIKAAVKYGAILFATEQALQAELLKLEQQQTEVEYNRQKALKSLGTLIAKEMDDQTVLTRPALSLSSDRIGKRPELKLFTLQENQLETSKELISKAKSPKLFGFGQLGYGNPGLNMMDNSFQEFYMVGLKLNWTVFDWGKNKKQQQAVELSKEILETEKETFVLNNSLQLQEAESDIGKYQAMLEKDVAIIQLREQVLQVATSQFQNGAIPSSEYISELNNLYEAKIAQELNQTQLSLSVANYKLIQGN